MLKSLIVRNFRSLEDFSIPKLGRINLIVGKNNSGKSSVLEALRIFAGNAELSLLEDIALGHDEKIRLRDDDLDDENSPMPFEEFFSGRVFPKEDGKSIEIGDLASNSILAIEHGYYTETEESHTDELGEVSFRLRRKRLLKTELDSFNVLTGQALFVQKGDRSSMLRFDSRTSRIRSMSMDMPKEVPCSVIPTQFISVDELADEWDKIALTDNQEIVKEALKLISSDFQDITFIRNNEGRTSSYRRSFTRSALIRISNHSRPVPLNSLGDGMLRVLQLVLKIFPAKGGILLIDEFENGLHYSVQEKIWGLIFEMAVKLDIQVFATTHSWDCIESFAKVSNENKNVEGVLIRVGQSARDSTKGRVIATVFDEDQLINLTQSAVEVR